MVNTRASSHTMEGSSAGEESYEGRNPRRSIRHRLSHQSNQNEVAQSISGPKRARSKAHLQQDVRPQSSNQQQDHTKQRSEAWRRYFEDDTEAPQESDDTENASQITRRSEYSNLRSVPSGDREANPRRRSRELRRIQLGLSAVEERGDGSRLEPNDGYEPSMLKSRSGDEECQPEKSDSDTNTQNADFNHDTRNLHLTGPGQLRIQPVQFSNWLSTELQPQRLSNTSQNHDSDLLKQGRNVWSATETMATDDLRSPSYFETNSELVPSLSHASDSSLMSGHESLEPSSRALPEYGNGTSSRQPIRSSQDHCSTLDADAAAQKKSLHSQTRKSFSSAFVENLKRGSRYWYRKPRLFCMSVALASWTFYSELCSALPINRDVDRLQIALECFERSPLEPICLFGSIQLFYIGILDVLDELANVLANMGVQSAHKQTVMGQNKSERSYNSLTERLLDTLWFSTCLDLLNKVLEPLSMLTSTLAFRVLLGHVWPEQWESASEFNPFKFCFTSFCLHLIKWGLDTFEDVLGSQHYQVNRWTVIQRPIKTVVLLLFLLSAAYIHRGLVRFNLAQTWQYATAYSRGGYVSFGGRRTIRKIARESNW